MTQDKELNKIYTRTKQGESHGLINLLIDNRCKYSFKWACHRLCTQYACTCHDCFHRFIFFFSLHWANNGIVFKNLHLFSKVCI